MSLPQHRRVETGRTFASTYTEYCGIEHARASIWPRALGWVVLLGCFVGIGVMLAWRG